jgi:putative Holliday junction resolvase
MRYLGIDFGSKRVGVALSDESLSFALPHSVLDNDKKLIEKIKKIISESGVNKIVVGESLDYAGKPNKIMEKIEEFKKSLGDETQIEIILEPEFMTSSQAKLLQGENSMHDASAASLILQSYLDKLK